ncbi:hypothetical protein EBESD8_15990 [Rhodococcus aetherivorans]|nr:hypothetical protein EBESD8_15990 [Rhodococcus aetherivorans]
MRRVPAARADATDSAIREAVVAVMSGSAGVRSRLVWRG